MSISWCRFDLSYNAVCLQASITKFMPNQPSEEAGPARRAGRKLTSIPETGTAVQEGPKRGRGRKAAGAAPGAGNAAKGGRGAGKAARKGKQAAAAAYEGVSDDDSPSGPAKQTEQVSADAGVSPSSLSGLPSVHRCLFGTLGTSNINSPYSPYHCRLHVHLLGLGLARGLGKYCVFV